MPYVPVVLILMLIYVTSLLGLTIPQQREWYLYYTTFFIGMHAFILLIYHKEWNKSSLIFVGTVLLFGFLIELLASQVGLYGTAYNYETTLTDSFFGPTLIMAVLWLVIIYSSSSLVAKLRELSSLNLPTAAIFNGLLSLALAALFQELAKPLDLWTLDSTMIYYIIWFLAGGGFQVLFQRLNLDHQNKISFYIYGGLVLFLIGVIFFLGRQSINL